MTVPDLVTPHGGELVDRIVPAADVESWRTCTTALPTSCWMRPSWRTWS